MIAVSLVLPLLGLGGLVGVEGTVEAGEGAFSSLAALDVN